MENGILFLQSSYSMLKSLIPLEELVIYAKKSNYEFVALTDEYLHGTIEFFNLCKKHKIKPVLGVRVEVLEPLETVFLVYVKNNIGYKNLLKIVKLKAFSHKFDIKDLIKYQKGLIFVSAGYESNIDKTVLYGNGNIDEILTKYNNNFDDFYVGLSLNHDIQKNVSLDLIYEKAKDRDIKILPVHQTNYINIDDKETYEILLKISNHTNKIDKDANYNFLSIEEIRERYSKYPLVFDNLRLFLKTITFDIPKISYKMPTFQTKNNVSPKEYLESLAKRGLKKRLEQNNIKNDKVYIERLDHELKVIFDMNFENYFLIVYDFVRYAKMNNILVGPGRGSAAGSLVSYTIGITNIDPILYDLMFERFLNPARMSMPDIDLDFPDNKRDLVIDYVKNKYGVNHICSISTYSQLGIKSAIRDVARTMNLSQTRVSAIINLVINDKVLENDKEIVNILKIVKKIQGLYRQTGTHAAGIILSDSDLNESVPLQKGSFDFYQSQYDASTLASLGLYKIDFLGIRNLAIIHDVLEVLEINGSKIDINLIPLDDLKTYELLSKGDTIGIFQLESEGMKKVLTKLKPEIFEDIVATLALYRPGPMENIDIYIKRRHGKKFNYIVKELENILKSTYGIIIYQEQIMQIAKEFAGYSLFEADLLRVGISKKKVSIMEQERSKFVSGAILKGYQESTANLIYDYILKFADYGFNRSHSVSYALVAYQMAYLKANHYLVFMSVLLTSVIGNQTQTNDYIRELVTNGYEVLPPNINISTSKYIIMDKKLIMPLTSIKGFGIRVTSDLLKEREKGKFDSFINFKNRVSNIISEQQLKNLVFSNSLDLFNINKKTMAENSSFNSIGLEKFIKDFKLKEYDEYNYKENQENELDVLGINIKYDIYKVILKMKKNDIDLIKDIANKDKATVLGYIESIKQYTTKDNKKMLFLEFTDDKDSINITVFNNVLLKNKNEFSEGIKKVTVKKNIYNEKTTYILEKIETIEYKNI